MNLHFHHPLKDTNVALGSFQFWQEHAIRTELVALIKIPTKFLALIKIPTKMKGWVDLMEHSLLT